jgi:Tol biopolymer transport system component
VRLVTAILLVMALPGCDGRRLAGQPPELRGAGSLAGALADATREQNPLMRRIWSGPGTDMSGTPSPDGRFLSFTDWSTFSLAVRDIDTGEVRVIVRGSLERLDIQFPQNSVFSPDGSRLAFSWFRGTTMEVRVVGLDGSEPRVLDGEADGLRPSYALGWTPDRQRLLVLLADADDVESGLGFVGVEDGAVQVARRFPPGTEFVRDATVPALSPDGRYIAYEAAVGGGGARQRDIHVVAADGSRDEVVVRSPADDRLLGWTPDGRILFGSERDGRSGIWALRMHDGRPDGAPELLKADVWGVLPMGFTRDGAFFYGVIAGGVDVYTAGVDVEGGRLLSAPVVASHRRLGFNQGIDWSPDGRYVAYLIRLGAIPASRAVLAIRDERNGEVRELNPRLEYINPALSWSPDGRTILAPAYDERRQYGLYRIDASTGGVEQLVSIKGVVHRPSWGPDGRSIFYFARILEGAGNRTPPARLVHHDLTTGTARDLVTGEDLDATAVSYDGAHMAYVRGGPGVESTLYVQGVRGGEPRRLVQIPAPGGIRTLAWSRDGRHLVYGRSDNWLEAPTELWSVPFDGGEASRLGLNRPGVSGLRMHPDGRRIGFSAGDFDSEVWIMETRPARGDSTSDRSR